MVVGDNWWTDSQMKRSHVQLYLKSTDKWFSFEANSHIALSFNSFSTCHMRVGMGIVWFLSDTGT